MYFHLCLLEAVKVTSYSNLMAWLIIEAIELLGSEKACTSIKTSSVSSDVIFRNVVDCSSDMLPLLLESL